MFEFDQKDFEVKLHVVLKGKQTIEKAKIQEWQIQFNPQQVQEEAQVAKAKDKSLVLSCHQKYLKEDLIKHYPLQNLDTFALKWPTCLQCQNHHLLSVNDLLGFLKTTRKALNILKLQFNQKQERANTICLQTPKPLKGLRSVSQKKNEQSQTKLLNQDFQQQRLDTENEYFTLRRQSLLDRKTRDNKYQFFKNKFSSQRANLECQQWCRKQAKKVLRYPSRPFQRNLMDSYLEESLRKEKNQMRVNQKEEEKEETKLKKQKHLDFRDKYKDLLNQGFAYRKQTKNLSIFKKSLKCQSCTKQFSQKEVFTYLDWIAPPKWRKNAFYLRNIDYKNQTASLPKCVNLQCDQEMSAGSLAKVIFKDKDREKQFIEEILYIKKNRIFPIICEECRRIFRGGIDILKFGKGYYHEACFNKIDEQKTIKFPINCSTCNKKQPLFHEWNKHGKYECFECVKQFIEKQFQLIEARKLHSNIDVTNQVIRMQAQTLILKYKSEEKTKAELLRTVKKKYPTLF